MSPLYESRDPERALAIAKRCLPPSAGLYWRCLALAQLRAERWEDAINSAEQAMTRLDGGNSVDRLILAIACWNSGQPDKARHWYAEATQRQHQALVCCPTLGPLAVEKLQSEAEAIIDADRSDGGRR